VLCTYFSAWTASILGISKYVTGIAPASCNGTCTSVFLPGGVETARVLGPNLNITLLEGGIFNNADAFLIHDAPGFHLEFFPIAADYSFNRTNDCNLYGESRGQGAYICVGSYHSSIVAGWFSKRTLGGSLLTLIGWSVCPSDLFTNGACFSNRTWTNNLDQTTSMSTFKRYATVAYDRQNFSILSIESISPPEPVTYDPKDFRSIYSKLLVPPASVTNDDTITVDALLFQLGWLLRLYQDDYGDDKESPLTYLRGFLTIPLQFYTAAFIYANATSARNGISIEGIDLSLPSDLVTKVSAALTRPRAIAKQWTFWVFTGTASVLILWCWSIFVWILKQETISPNISSFAEIDFGSRWFLSNSQRVLGGNNQSAVEGFQSMLRDKSLGNAKTKDIVEAVKDSILRVAAVQDSTSTENEEVIVLATAAMNSTEENLERVEGLRRLEPNKKYS